MFTRISDTTTIVTLSKPRILIAGREEEVVELESQHDQVVDEVSVYDSGRPPNGPPFLANHSNADTVSHDKLGYVM